MYNYFLLVITFISLCSCASNELTKRFSEKKFAYNTFLVDGTHSKTLIKGFVTYSTSKEDNCFRANGLSDDGDIITVQVNDLEKAVNYFYKNKTTWNIRQTYTEGRKRYYGKKKKQWAGDYDSYMRHPSSLQDQEYRTIEMFAEAEDQFSYEVAYCGFRIIGPYFEGNRDYEYASFRLIK